MEPVHSERDRHFQRMSAILIPDLLTIELGPPEPQQIVYSDRYVRIVWGALLGPAAVNTYLFLGDLHFNQQIEHTLSTQDLGESVGVGWKGNNAVVRYALRRLLMFRVITQPNRDEQPEHMVVPLSVRPVPYKQIPKLPAKAAAYHRATLAGERIGVG